MKLEFDKTTKRWQINAEGERWNDCTTDTVRQMLAQHGLPRKEVTTIMAKAKCLAYGIDI